MNPVVNPSGPGTVVRDAGPLDEGALFEGLRVGSVQAFDALLRAYDPPMRRLARLHVPEERVPAVVRQTWSTALPGLDMFTWHTTLRAWVTGICVGHARARRTGGLRGQEPAVAAVAVVPARDDAAAASARPVPWSSLGWSQRWDDAGWRRLEDALAAQPRPVAEVLWLHDVEGWARREVLDALGLTAEQGDRLLRQGRGGLAAVVAAHVGADPDPAGQERERSTGVAALLASLRPVHPDPVADAELQRLFLTWRRSRGVRPWRRWRWELANPHE